MKQFELFTMIFYVLDYYWDQNHGEELGEFLSDMSPFTFTDIGSADPAVYSEFCDFIKVDKIEIETVMSWHANILNGLATHMLQLRLNGLPKKIGLINVEFIWKQSIKSKNNPANRWLEKG